MGVSAAFWELGLGTAGWKGMVGMDGVGNTLPGVRAQRALKKGHGATRQPSVAAAEQDEPLAQAFLQVA